MSAAADPGAGQAGRTFRWRRGLFAKFLLILSPIFLAACLPGVWFLIAHELRQDQELLAARIGNHAARTALALERNLSGAASAAAQDLIATLAVDRAFLCAQLTDTGPGSGPGRAVLAQPQGLDCANRTDGNVFSLPVGESGSLRLLVRYTDSELREARAKQLSIAMMVVAIAFVVAVLASAAGFSFIVNRPLGLLLASIQRSALTGQRMPVPVRGQDELHRVIRAFNDMIEREVERERSLTEANARLQASEVALRDANEGLETRVRERTAELNAAKDRADDANRAKSRFLATMSHELRTPLNAIIGFSDLIVQQAFGRLGNERYADFAKDINAGGVHLLRLINDILDISKIEAGSATLAESEADVAGLMDQCLRFVRPLAENKSIALTECPSVAALRIVADPTKLKQVLINILTNAVKFTAAGGSVAFGVSLDPARGLVFSVRDTGIGMSAAEIPQALEPFVQVDNEMSRSQEGTGLGLPMAKMLTELHGGTLHIESRPGVGTEVTVTLPASRVVGRSAAAA